MNKLALFASALALVAASPALAADPVYEPSSAVFSWTGGYVGVAAGYVWSDSTADYDDTGFPGFHANIDPDGFFGGLYGGFNSQLSSGIVLGIEGDINYNDAEGSGPLLSPADVIVPGQSFSGQIDWSGSVRARVGYAVDRFLPYVTGGVAFANYSVTNTVFGVSETAVDDTLTGWTVGVGADYAFTDNLIGRVEYRYTDFGRERAGTVVFDDYDVDLSTQDIRAGLAYKF